MNQGNLSRRGFLARSLTALTVGGGLPLWYAQEIVMGAQEKQSQTPGANDRIVMGAIGTGTNRFKVNNNAALRGERGVQIMRDAMGRPGVQMIAVADVDSVNKDYGASVAGRDCKKFEDFRELLALREIDAVTIGTPDHWHALVAIAALKAGKHVYCEKPLTLTLAEGKALVRAQRETGKTFQTGSQQRSDDRFRLACEMVRNGRIGRVRQITTLIGNNPVGGPFPIEAPPPGLNWDFWQGPTAATPFIKMRCHYEFRWWYEYSGGKMTDWGAHHNDIAQWALGMDNSGPIAVTGSGTTPPSDGRSYNCHRDFVVTYLYGNGSQNLSNSPSKAGFVVRVPEPSAEVWFGDYQSQQRGLERHYETDNLDPNHTFPFQVRARWQQNGQPMEVTRWLDARAGQNITVDFTGNGQAPAPSGEGTRLVCRSGPPARGWRHPGNGVLFEGENGMWIWVERGRIAASDGDARTSRILNDPLGTSATRLEVSRNHMGNFIDCCRTGRLPICNVNVGYRSVTVCHLGTIATRFFPGQLLQWDPQQERFTGQHAQAANTHLSRPYRAPWRLEA